MSRVLTEIRVKIVGGPSDGWSGTIRVPLQDEADGWIRLTGDSFKPARENPGVRFRVKHGGERILLVHPSAVGLFWN